MVEHMNHDADYPPEYLADILKSVKTIAMVGASSDVTKFSYGVLRVLHETGYDMAPVNPREAGGEIRGIPVYGSLKEIDRPVDMVQVFRASDQVMPIAEEAVAIGAKVLWMQIGVRNDEAAKLAEDAGMRVVMNRCPKIELFRPFWKPRLNQQIDAPPAVAPKSAATKNVTTKGAKKSFADLHARMQSGLRDGTATNPLVVTVKSEDMGGFACRLTMRDHEIVSDQPYGFEGTNKGPKPSELLLASLAACQHVTWRLYADVMGVEIDDIAITVRGTQDLRGFMNVDDAVPAGFMKIEGDVAIQTKAPRNRVEALQKIVDEHCPVLDDLLRNVPSSFQLKTDAPRRANGATLPRSSNTMVEAAKRHIEEVDAADAIELAKSGQAVIIDIREPDELQKFGAIPGATHCPRGLVEFSVDPEDKSYLKVFGQDAKFLFCCATGRRSALTVETLQRMGFANAANLRDGFVAWKKAGGAVEGGSGSKKKKTK